MIAVMNQANSVAIMLSEVLNKFIDRVVVNPDWPRSAVFAMMAVMTLPVAVFYRRHVDVQPIKPRRKAGENSMGE